MLDKLSNLISLLYSRWWHLCIYV